MDNMTTYQKIKEVLDANMLALSSQMEMNRQVVSVQLSDLKKDTQEIKEHAIKTNGHVADNLERIHRLELLQSSDEKLKQRGWMHITIIGLIIVTLANIVHEIGLWDVVKGIF